MSKFFIDKNAINNELKSITITGEDVNHIKNVLRAVPGDIIVLCDQNGNDYFTSISIIEKEKIIANITDIVPNNTEPPVDITLFQGIPKSDKMDFIIQKCVELGVTKIVPVITERTIVKFNGTKDIESKTTRWQRICLEAAKQCNRGIVPFVEKPVKLYQSLETSGDYALNIIPYEKESSTGLKSLIQSSIKGKISIFIGPEGGFSEDEIKYALNKGVRPVTLGPRILRTETAGLAVLSMLMYQLGDMG